MLLWCAVCQRFLGEREPRDRIEVSHGICPTCNPLPEQEQIERLRPLREFHQRLFARVVDDSVGPVDFGIVNEAKQLGVRPTDLLIGVMQPILYRIGELYSQGQVAASQEHEFSRFVASFLNELIRRNPEWGARASLPKRTQVLLVCVEGNYHDLGPRFLELFFRSNQIDATAVYPSLPNHEVVELAAKLQPQIVGISVSMSSQIAGAERLVEALRSESFPSPQISVGGYGVPFDRVIPGAHVYQGRILELLDWTQKDIQKPQPIRR